MPDGRGGSSSARNASARGGGRQLRGHARPAAAAGDDLAGRGTCTPSSRTSSSTEAEWAARDRLPDPHRADVQRRAAGVHPALRRARRLDARRDDQPPHRRHVHRVHRARAVPHGRVARRERWATTSPWTARATPCLVSGRVTGPTASRSPAPRVDVWQANEDGFYDVQQPERPAGGQPARAVHRRRRRAGSGSRRSCPRYYPIPDDGPVGQLLAATGRHPYRPAHLHFIASAPGYRPVTTHVFVAAVAVPRLRRCLRGQGEPDPRVPEVDDPARAAEADLSNPFRALTFDLTLLREAPAPS